MVLPSLILRLEQLAHPDAPRAPIADSDPAPVAAPPVEPSTATTSSVAEYPVTTPPVTSPSEPTSPVAPPATYELSSGGEPAGTARRVVDVAAPERLSTATPLSRWSAAVAAAHDACFVLDLNGVVISVSIAAIELLGCGDVSVIGRHVLDILNLVDLETGAAHPDYAPRITPLAVLEGPGLGRSLMRVRHGDGAVVTLDTSSAPIHDVNAHLLGSVTFIAPIRSR